MLQGYATISRKSSRDSLSVGQKYTCQEQMVPGKTVIAVYVRGYTPVVFLFDYAPSKLATIEVPMVKSCSGGPSCLDNTRIFAGLYNESVAEQMTNWTQDKFSETIKQQFGLDKSDYQLECMECDMNRGGFIKAKGTYKDGSPLALYYRQGWCSSGGADCGWNLCFTTRSDDLFSSVENGACNQISAQQSHDVYTCSATTEAYDKTDEVRSSCLAGGFENNDGVSKTLAIAQSRGRCVSSVEKGVMDCLGN